MPCKRAELLDTRDPYDASRVGLDEPNHPQQTGRGLTFMAHEGLPDGPHFSIHTAEGVVALNAKAMRAVAEEALGFLTYRGLVAANDPGRQPQDARA